MSRGSLFSFDRVYPLAMKFFAVTVVLLAVFAGGECIGLFEQEPTVGGIHVWDTVRYIYEAIGHTVPSFPVDESNATLAVCQTAEGELLVRTVDQENFALGSSQSVVAHLDNLFQATYQLFLAKKTEFLRQSDESSEFFLHVPIPYRECDGTGSILVTTNQTSAKSIIINDYDVIAVLNRLKSMVFVPQSPNVLPTCNDRLAYMPMAPYTSAFDSKPCSWMKVPGWPEGTGFVGFDVGNISSLSYPEHETNITIFYIDASNDTIKRVPDISRDAFDQLPNRTGECSYSLVEIYNSSFGGPIDTTIINLNSCPFNVGLQIESVALASQIIPYDATDEIIDHRVYRAPTKMSYDAFYHDAYGYIQTVFPGVIDFRIAPRRDALDGESDTLYPVVILGDGIVGGFSIFLSGAAELLFVKCNSVNYAQTFLPNYIFAVIQLDQPEFTRVRVAYDNTNAHVNITINNDEHVADFTDPNWGMFFGYFKSAIFSYPTNFMGQNIGCTPRITREGPRFYYKWDEHPYHIDLLHGFHIYFKKQ